jgi:hypothetical protein
MHFEFVADLRNQRGLVLSRAIFFLEILEAATALLQSSKRFRAVAQLGVPTFRFIVL